MKNRIIFSNWLRRVLRKTLMPKYWICDRCALIVYKEEEVSCWRCHTGEMIYQGEYFVTNYGGDNPIKT